MNFKRTRSRTSTAKVSKRGNNDYEVLRLENFQGPLISNSITFKAMFRLQGLSRFWKNRYFFKDFHGSVATLAWYWIHLILASAFTTWPDN